MKKHLFLFLMMLLPIIASADAVEIDGIYYNLIPKGKAAEVTTNPTKYIGTVIIPKTVNYDGITYDVTSILGSAFSNCKDLTSVTIPNSVTSIGDKAFQGCSGLTSIIIPSSVTSIGEYTFSGCSGLTSVTIPNSIINIGKYAFYNCSGLTSVTIPNSITTIEDYTFRGCSNLTNIIIPKTINRIGISAFEGCGSLTAITIPNSVMTVDFFSFKNCSSLSSVVIEDGDKQIYYKTYEDINYLKPAFYGCPIENIYVGRNLSYTSSGSAGGNYHISNAPISPFSGTTIKKMTIGVKVTTILEGFCGGCGSLKELHISDLEAWCKITFNDNPLIYAQHLYLKGEEIKDLVIPNSVTNIGKSTFSGWSSLMSISIPNSVTSIGAGAFSGCTGLTSVIIPNSVTSIGAGAFSGCTGLTSVIIPNSVTNLEGKAFSDCTRLTNLTIGNSVINIGVETFYGCNSLMNVTIGNSVKSIENYAFKGCSSLKGINIPNSVNSIGIYAFCGCSILTNITIGNSVNEIGGYAFQNCGALTSVTIPNSTKIIGESAFEGCGNLTNVTIGTGINTIKSKAFASCPELTDVYCFAVNVPEMKDYYGYNCTNVFEDSYIEYATLHVPVSAFDSYKTKTPWNTFKSIVTLDGSEPPTPPTPPIPEVKKCATPTIAYKDGKLKFTCETGGAEFISEVTVADAKKYYDAEVPLLGVYHVTAYAMKSGYDNSDVATADFVIKGSTVTLVGDVNNDGKVDATDITKLIDILLKR